MEAKKLISTTVEGVYETKKFHTKDIPISYSDLEDVCNDYLSLCDDCEDAYLKGVSYFFDETIHSINVSDFIKTLEQKFEYEDEEEVPDYVINLYNILCLNKDYILYPKKE